MSQNSEQVIPAIIFQTWYTKILPPLMFNAINTIKQLNPNFKHYLFDDNDCREFIKKHFDPNVLNAYDRLIPGAYKADLWRYCVLYINGGIYLDIKYVPFNNFKFKNLLNREYWILDRSKEGIYNALMVCKPGNPILIKAINQIVENVKNKFYGNSFLAPTGPRLLRSFFSEKDIQNIDSHHFTRGELSHDKYIKIKNRIVVRGYEGYFGERDNNSIIPHYSTLWHNRRVYL